MSRVISCAVLVAMLATGLFASATSAATPEIIYQNKPNPVPGNVLSEAFQAQTVSEFGDRIQFEPATSRLLDSVEVLMSEWGCESGRWENNDCSTTPGLTFDHPITINFYNVGPSNSVGSLIGTRTQTFAVPYRPSKDDTNCTNPGTDSNGGNDLGKWYNAGDDTCYNGYTFPITFDLTSLNTTVPDEVIVSIAFNTTDYGPSPIGSQACDTPSTGCGYDALNVGLSSVPGNVSFGTNPAPNDAYMEAHVGGSGTGYCTNTDLDTFRLDGSCYNGLKLAITVFTPQTNGNITIVLDTHPDTDKQFSFTGTNGIAPFTLFDDGNPTNNTKSFDVPAGLYVFRVAAESKWALMKLTCNMHETILKAHRLVQIQLQAGDDVVCTFTESLRKPDAMIGLMSGGPYSGDNIYSGNVLASQTQTRSFNPGQTKSFFMRFQNDSLDKDWFRVASKLTGSLKYHVVFMNGTTEITGKVNAGTYRLKLAPGATRTIELRVTAGANLSASDVRDIVVTMQSRTAPAARDTVKAHVQTAP
jgi:hypothetical protein